MKINKINDKKLIISLTEEELYFDYDINLEDLTNLESRPKISQILIDIVKKAANKTNINLSGGMKINLRLNELNEIEIEVIIEQQFNENNLQGIAKFLKSIINENPDSKLMLNDIFNKMKLTPEAIDKVHCLMESINTNEYIFEKEEDELKELLTYIYIADKLNELITIAPLINNFVKSSTIYKINDKYYLELHAIENKDKHIINIMNEFMLKRNDNISIFYLLEHGNILIKNNAIAQLSNL